MPPVMKSVMNVEMGGLLAPYLGMLRKYIMAG